MLDAAVLLAAVVVGAGAGPTRECSSYTTQRGVLNYPPGGMNYLNNDTDCWELPCTHVRLRWDRFAVEAGYDTVAVNGEEVRAKTAVTRPEEKVYSSAAEKTHIAFRSDGSVAWEGFKVAWDCVGESEPLCAFNTTNTTGTLQHPLGGAYKNNEKSCWVIRVSQGDAVILKWHHFDLEDAHDLVRINTLPVRGSTPYTVPPPSVHVDTVHIQFSSDWAYSGQGFALSWEPYVPSGTPESEGFEDHAPTGSGPAPVNTDTVPSVPEGLQPVGAPTDTGAVPKPPEEAEPMDVAKVPEEVHTGEVDTVPKQLEESQPVETPIDTGTTPSVPEWLEPVEAPTDIGVVLLEGSEPVGAPVIAPTVTEGAEPVEAPTDSAVVPKLPEELEPVGAPISTGATPSEPVGLGPVEAPTDTGFAPSLLEGLEPVGAPVSTGTAPTVPEGSELEGAPTDIGVAPKLPEELEPVDSPITTGQGTTPSEPEGSEAAEAPTDLFEGLEPMGAPIKTSTAPTVSEGWVPAEAPADVGAPGESSDALPVEVIVGASLLGGILFCGICCACVYLWVSRRGATFPMNENMPY